jgi:hypothetical protein
MPARISLLLRSITREQFDHSVHADIEEDFICELTFYRERSSPIYELPDHTTKRRKLSELQGEDLLVLVLSRS